MSLINEALKKAQKQRTGEAEPLPAVGGESAARIARRGKPAGFNGLMLGIGAGVAALIAVIVVAVIFLRRPAAETTPANPAPVVATPAVPTQIVPAPVAQTPAVQTPAPKPVEVAPQPVAPPLQIVVPSTNATASVAKATPPKVEPVKLEPLPPKVEAPATVVAAPVISSPVTAVPVAAAPVITAPPATPRAPGKMEHRAVTFIESIRVAGIRASGSDRKVLMNDRVYRLNDLVEPEMGLTLVGIATNSLTFQDENGAKYTRNF